MSSPPPAPILALDKISKRFGAIVIAEAVDLVLGDGNSCQVRHTANGRGVNGHWELAS